MKLSMKISSSSSSQQEKSSNFSQTCNLLSQYLKEKGNFGDLSFRMTHNLEGRSSSSGPLMASNEVKPMDLFPQSTGFGPSPSSMDSCPPKKVNSRSSIAGHEAAQMTIFYGGKVLVFDNFPAEKAEEILVLGRKENSEIVLNKTSKLQDNSPKQISNSFVMSKQDMLTDSIPYQPIVTNLPIARNASIQRFLEKRKDRLLSKAPYQITSKSVSSTTSQSSTPDTKTWLGLTSGSK